MASSCYQTLAGILRDCATNMGGVRSVRLANKADVTAAVTDKMVSSITMASTSKFHKYEFTPNTASMSSNYKVNLENGSKYVQTDLVLVFNRMETTKRIEISAMAQAELCAIVEDANGVFWFLGFDEPIILTAGDGLTGTARGDRNGYSATLQDNSLEMPYEVKTGSGGVDLDSITA